MLGRRLIPVPGLLCALFMPPQPTDSPLQAFIKAMNILVLKILRRAAYEACIASLESGKQGFAFCNLAWQLLIPSLIYLMQGIMSLPWTDLYGGTFVYLIK